MGRNEDHKESTAVKGSPLRAHNLRRRERRKMMKKGGNIVTNDERNVPFSVLLSLRFEKELSDPSGSSLQKSMEVGGITFRSEGGKFYKVDMAKAAGNIRKDDAHVMDLELSEPDYDVYKDETPFIPQKAIMKMDAIINADINLWTVKESAPETGAFLDEGCETPVKLEDAIISIEGQTHRLSPDGCRNVTFGINDGDIMPDTKHPQIQPDDSNCLYTNRQLMEALEQNNIPVTEKNIKVLTDKAGWIKTKNDRQYFRDEIGKIQKDHLFEESSRKTKPDKVVPLGKSRH